MVGWTRGLEGSQFKGEGVKMNLRVEQSVARFRRSLSIVALVVCVLAAAPDGRAQAPVVVATLTNNGSPVVTITGNQSFTLTLMLNMNFPSSGYTYFLQSNAAGSGFFTITNVDRSGSPFGDGSPIPGPCGIACVLNPRNDFDLGGSTPGGGITPPGQYTVATISFSTTNAPIGQYTISTSQGIVTDRTGGAFNDVPFNALATINVVPEPGAVALAVVGGLSMLVAFRRKNARR
jgi:hypothetical protein